MIVVIVLLKYVVQTKLDVIFIVGKHATKIGNAIHITTVIAIQEYVIAMGMNQDVMGNAIGTIHAIAIQEYVDVMDMTLVVTSATLTQIVIATRDIVPAMIMMKDVMEIVIVITHVIAIQEYVDVMDMMLAVAIVIHKHLAHVILFVLIVQQIMVNIYEYY